MSSTQNLKANNTNEEIDLTDCNHYIRKSSLLVKDALNKGLDVIHLADGSIMLTEVKTVTYKYVWNSDKKKFERSTRVKRKTRS